MQPFPDPTPPERRGRFTLIALLVAGVLVATTVAVVAFGQLRSANERIEELESGESGGSGPLGEFGDIVEDLLGDPEGLLGGAGELGSLFECLGGGGLGATGEAGTTVEEIAQQVEGIRELAFEHDVKPVFLNDQEMTARVRKLFLQDYTPEVADLEQRLLTTLGAIPPGTNLRELRANAIGQQVAGFYEPETGELVVRQSGAEISAIDRITLSHELDHALTDQTLEIPLPDDPVIGTEDASLAALALVEGDATLVMQRYSSTLGLDEQLQLLDPALIAQAEAGLGGFPPYLEQELSFPYEEGLTFVCDLYANGGWDAVNAAYANPPTSSAQILFPERYLDGPDESVDVPDARAPAKGWTRVGHVQVGPANLLWLFSAPGGDPSDAIDGARDEVALWNGGEATIWRRGSETAVGLVLSESDPATGSLCEAVKAWYDRSFDDDRSEGAAGTATYDGPHQDAAIVCGNGQPLIAVGIASTVREALGLAAVL